MSLADKIYNVKILCFGDLTPEDQAKNADVSESIFVEYSTRPDVEGRLPAQRYVEQRGLTSWTSHVPDPVELGKLAIELGLFEDELQRAADLKDVTDETIELGKKAASLDLEDEELRVAVHCRGFSDEVIEAMKRTDGAGEVSRCFSPELAEYLAKEDLPHETLVDRLEFLDELPLALWRHRLVGCNATVDQVIEQVRRDLT